MNATDATAMNTRALSSGWFLAATCHEGWRAAGEKHINI